MSSADSGRGGSHADVSHISAASADAEQAEKRRANPLSELITTEVRYVAELSMIIRRVAGAWSPTNFPPPELDAMFRAIEVVFRTNNTFLRSLQEIGPNPSSPKGLGNLLMQWIGNLYAPYKQYCSVYCTHLDTWAPIVDNRELPPILAQASRDIPRSTTGDANNAPAWTLDALFALPIARLRFYKKLYARLLRSTQPGRSDHDLLLSANERLDTLLDLAQQRGSVTSGAQKAAPAAPALPAAPVAASAPKPAPPIGAPAPVVNGAAPPIGAGGMPQPAYVPAAGTAPAPLHVPSIAAGSASAGVSPRQALTVSLEQQSIGEIQDRINSSYTIDIFTMKPKSCRLQINPSSLPFQRKLRITDGAVMHVKPANHLDTRIVQAARLILLTDLVLIGEDVAAPPGQAPSKQDVWLMFPPLAGKFIEATSYGEPHEHAIRIQVMKRAEVLVYLASEERKAAWLREFRACYEFGVQRMQPSSGMQRAPSQTGPYRSGSVGSSARPLHSSPAPAPPLPNAAAPASAPAPSAAPPKLEPTPAAPPKSTGTDAAPATPLPMPGGFVPGPTALTTLDARPQPAGPAPSMGAGARTASGAPLPSAAPGGPGVPHAPLNAPPNAAPGAMAPGASRAARPGLPPLLVPTQTVSEALPGVPLGEQDAGLGSPLMHSAHLTRENSLNSVDSFPRAGGARRADTPEQRVGSPLMTHSVPVSPTRAAFGAPGAPPSVAAASVQEPPRQTSSPMSMRFPPSPFGQGPAGGPRRPSEPNAMQANLAAPLRSHSQPRLGGAGSIKPPSQTLQEGGRQNSPDWLNLSDAPRPATVQEGRRPSFHLCAQMRCKVFLKQSYAQWKSLGSARLRVYHLQPTGTNQLVVQNDKKLIISTIVLPDAVERVGKTGLAVEISDDGRLTGVVYMLHMRSEESALGLFEQLLAGSSRTTLPSSPGLS